MAYNVIKERESGQSQKPQRKEMINMKLNKTLTQMKEALEEGGVMTIYGDKMYQKILNFKAVESCEVNGSDLTFKLSDGSEIRARYQD